MNDYKNILRVFPRRTKATPNDDNVRIGFPDLFDHDIPGIETVRERIYFNEPLDHDLTVTEMQKLWDQANAHIAILLQRTADRKEKREKDKKDK